MIKKKLILTLFVIVISSGTILAAEISNDAKLQYNRGVDYYRTGQFEEAVRAFKQAITLDANYIDAYYNLGVIYEQMHRDAEALSMFKQIIVREPTDYEAVYNAASLSCRLGQTEKAKQYLSIIPPTSPTITKARQLAAIMNTDLQTINAEQKERLEAQKPKIPQTNGSYENLISPTGIATDKNGNIYIASFSSNSITRITPDGERKLFVKSPQLNGPMGLVADTDGNLYVANYNSNNVIKITSTGTITKLLENILKPYCLHIDCGMLFISSQGSNSVIRYKL